MATGLAATLLHKRPSRSRSKVGVPRAAGVGAGPAGSATGRRGRLDTAPAGALPDGDGGAETPGSAESARALERTGAPAYMTDRAFHRVPMRSALKNLTAALIGLVAGLLLIEVLLTFFLPPPLRYRYPQALYNRDEQLGWVMRPGQHTFTIDQPVSTNALGFRSPEIESRDGKGLLVVCLGDSQTFGNGVAQDRTYPAVLQSLLAGRRPGLRVQVVNTGVQGYGPVQEVHLLDRLLSQLHPD